MKTLWQILNEYREYDEEGWCLIRMEAQFIFLWTKYKAELFMTEEKSSGDMKPYFMLENMETAKVVLRLSEELNHYGPMSDHWNEVSESLWDDCIDWVSSHK